MIFSERLNQIKEERIVVLTGAFLPETFKDSDADFNLGVAVGMLKDLMGIRTTS